MQRIEVDVDYTDHVSLAVDTKIIVNFPKPNFAILPISLGLTLVRFSGTVCHRLLESLYALMIHLVNARISSHALAFPSCPLRLFTSRFRARNAFDVADWLARQVAGHTES